MKTSELIEYLQTFEQDQEVEISVCNMNEEGEVIASDGWDIAKDNICVNVYHDGAVIEVLLTPKLKGILQLNE